ncbi:hypothetical protein E4Z66_03605 [Aliishimia ponticola]|uniref:Uncharacterized protein n=1 Tax=Aliishimia ponticola TaxID=2499833 RepID=A0A4S4NG90_9RHOB|nr:hypothetical protein [Aliishimia ponticola]THH38666.1 hypothetical protein E4Z66_03605 [Aliishimia ponticola]
MPGSFLSRMLKSNASYGMQENEPLSRFATTHVREDILLAQSAPHRSDANQMVMDRRDPAADEARDRDAGQEAETAPFSRFATRHNRPKPEPVAATAAAPVRPSRPVTVTSAAPKRPAPEQSAPKPAMDRPMPERAQIERPQMEHPQVERRSNVMRPVLAKAPDHSNEAVDAIPLSVLERALPGRFAAKSAPASSGFNDHFEFLPQRAYG